MVEFTDLNEGLCIRIDSLDPAGAGNGLSNDHLFTCSSCPSERWIIKDINGESEYHGLDRRYIRATIKCASCSNSMCGKISLFRISICSGYPKGQQWHKLWRLSKAGV